MNRCLGCHQYSYSDETKKEISETQGEIFNSNLMLRLYKGAAKLSMWKDVSDIQIAQLKTHQPFNTLTPIHPLF